MSRSTADDVPGKVDEVAKKLPQLGESLESLKTRFRWNR
jgi:hypothetical protein